MKQDSLIQLFNRYLNNQCSPEEIKTLLNHFEIEEDKNLLKGLILQQLQADNSLKKEEEDALSEVYLRIVEQIQIEKANGAKVVGLKRNRWLRYVAAAAVILLVALGVVYVWSERKPEDNLAKTQKLFPKNDVLPGGDKAILTLADGSTIVLDNAQNGTLTEQGATKVIKLDGKLAYDPAGAGSTEVVYNTINTPRGGQYQIELPDGSEVWLNAASSLRFPTAFAGKERRVEITGEAYFEVAKNKSMPFIVSVSGAEVQVLGTHFNVMAYKEENAVKTTLLEGSVRFVSGNNASLLKPGQQSQLTKEGQVKMTSSVDVDEVMAWKNGVFYFKNADIEAVMRQLSRWYDVDIVYQGEIKPKKFGGEIQRDLNLSEVLEGLKETGIQFRIEGKKLIVLP